MSTRVSVRHVESVAGVVAVKTATTPDEIAALAREAARLEQASHPGVVALVDHRIGEGAAELHTRFAGEALGRWRGTLPRLAGLGAAVAATLADLHQIGIVHGRIDASHVLVGDDGRPRLCSFSSGSEAEPADDVAALGRLLGDLLAQIQPAARHGTIAWRRGPLAERRAFEQVLDHACDEVASRRPSAQAFAAALLAAVPGAELPPSGDAAPPAPHPAPGAHLTPHPPTPANPLAPAVRDIDAPDHDPLRTATPDQRSPLTPHAIDPHPPTDADTVGRRSVFDAEAVDRGSTGDGEAVDQGSISDARAGDRFSDHDGEAVGQRSIFDVEDVELEPTRDVDAVDRRSISDGDAIEQGAIFGAGADDGADGDHDDAGDVHAMFGAGAVDGRSSLGVDGDDDDDATVEGEGDEDPTDVEWLPFDEVFGDQTDAGLDEVFADRPWPARPRVEGQRSSRPDSELTRRPGSVPLRRLGAEPSRRRLGRQVAVGLVAAAAVAGVVLWTGHRPRPERSSEAPQAAPPSGEAAAACPWAPTAEAPPNGAGHEVDVDGDGCPDDVRIQAGVVYAAGERWAVGGPEDAVAVGDWDCDGRATPALYRPATGDVFVFPTWAAPGEPLTVDAVAQVSGGQALTVEAGASGDCDVPLVELAGGEHHAVDLPSTERSAGRAQ